MRTANINRSVLVAAALTVAACDSRPIDQNTSETTPLSELHPTPAAGRYEVTQFDYVLGEATGSTAQPVVLDRCISTGEAAEPETLLAGPSLPGCPERAVELTDGHIGLTYQCQNPAGSISGNGSYSGSEWEMTVDLTVYGQSTRYEEKAKRTGDC